MAPSPTWARWPTFVTGRALRRASVWVLSLSQSGSACDPEIRNTSENPKSSLPEARNHPDDAETAWHILIKSGEANVADTIHGK